MEKTQFSEGEVVIYEGHLEDRLMVVDKIYPKEHPHRPDNILLRSIDSLDVRDTTVDRIRKATREDLTVKILRLQSSLDTLVGAMKNQNFKIVKK